MRSGHRQRGETAEGRGRWIKEGRDLVAVGIELDDMRAGVVAVSENFNVLAADGRRGERNILRIAVGDLESRLRHHLAIALDGEFDRTTNSIAVGDGVVPRER